MNYEQKSPAKKRFCRRLCYILEKLLTASVNRIRGSGEPPRVSCVEDYGVLCCSARNAPKLAQGGKAAVSYAYGLGEPHSGQKRAFNPWVPQFGQSQLCGGAALPHSGQNLPVQPF